MPGRTERRSHLAKGEATRCRVVGSAVKMLSLHGLSGVTIGRVAEDADLSKSGMFAHFRSKEVLEIAVLNEAARLADEVIAKAGEQPPGLPRLRTFIDLWFGWPARAGLPGGCPIAAAIFELDDATGPVRDHVAALEAQMRTELTAMVVEVVDHGHLRTNTDVDQFVWELLGIYLAHHSATRFLKSPKAGLRAGIAVDALIGRNS